MASSRGKKPRPGDLRISLHGEKVDAEAISKVIGHTVAILKSITGEMYGDPELIQWNLAALEFACDGCGKTVSSIPDNWTKRGADDLCAKCSNGVSEASKPTAKQEKR